MIELTGSIIFFWIPAFAGMTPAEERFETVPHKLRDKMFISFSCLVVFQIYRFALDLKFSFFEFTNNHGSGSFFIIKGNNQCLFPLKSNI